MSQIPHTSPFDGIRHEDEHGKEFWSARELGKLLGYSSLQAFQNTIIKAREACEDSKEDVFYHFYLQIDVVITGKGSLRKTEAYRLSRYACYLIIMNADPHKPIVAVGQSYFAYQARRQEIAGMLALIALPDDEKRLILRFMLETFNTRLQKAAQQTSVVKPSDFATFFDNGCMGLYGGLRENDIHERKG
ncbi:MAG TPA: BRO family protein [Ktedonobacteraceae bacterium]